MKKLGLYIHIPFCLQKCKYCDFLSLEKTSFKEHTAYVEALKSEIEHYGQVYNNKFIVDTIFIGGGTPSFINEALIADIISVVKAVFNLTINAEVTIETNPKTLTLEKLKTYLDCGINRLSIGVQSLDDEMLKGLGRMHSSTDVFDNYAMAREAGFKNINVDLMFAIPNHTIKLWLETLTKIIQLKPEHISFYSLQLEQGTAFFDLFQRGELLQIPDDIDREMYHCAVEIFTNMGYRHYEISNCAMPDFECRHNLKYWSMEDYLGIGLGAHSFLDGIRFSHTRDLASYCKGSRDDWRYENTYKDNISEYIFTGMRKIGGIDLIDFESRFGKCLIEIYENERSVLDALDQYVREGYVQLEGGKMRFTSKGIDISNTILAEFV